MTEQKNDRKKLTSFAWLSVGAAVFTITLKSAAYFLTGSVGLLSDALESIVNLVGALMALAMLTIAARPADKEHTFGHSKAEYFSSGTEGALILIAAGSIIFTSVERIIHPQPLEKIGIGVIISVAASLANLVVSIILKRAGEKYNSITLIADAKHLMTDVWTSAGVLVGVGVVAVTRLQLLDPLVAIGVGINIIWSGIGIVRHSIAGLMDTSLDAKDQDVIQKILHSYQPSGAKFHALRTRLSGAVKFISMHVLVPGDWSVEKGHELVSQIESDLHKSIEGSCVFTHLEPQNTPASHDLPYYSEIDAR